MKTSLVMTMAVVAVAAMLSGCQNSTRPAVHYTADAGIPIPPRPMPPTPAQSVPVNPPGGYAIPQRPMPPSLLR